MDGAGYEKIVVTACGNSRQPGGKLSIVPVLVLIEDVVGLGLASRRLVDVDIILATCPLWAIKDCPQTRLRGIIHCLACS